MNVWNEVWNEDVYSNSELRELKAKLKVDKLLKHIQVKQSFNVLDVGCGGGYISRELYRKTGSKIIGIDSSGKAIELAKSKSKGMPIVYKCQDINTFNEQENNIDLVLCVGVIEHIKNYRHCIENIKKVLKDGGILYIISSNRDSFIYQQKVIRQRIGKWNYGYQKNWRLADLEAMLITNGFKTLSKEINSGIGNFKFIDVLDKIFSTNNVKRGRYIYYIGEVQK